MTDFDKPPVTAGTSPRGHHMRGVGALAATGGDQSQPDQTVDQHLEGHGLQVVGHQPGPKLPIAR